MLRGQISEDIPQFYKRWIINTIASIWLRKYAQIFVPGQYLSLDAHSFPRASLSENCSLLRTDNVRGQISKHIFTPNEGYCLFIIIVKASNHQKKEREIIIIIIKLVLLWDSEMFDSFSCSCSYAGSKETFKAFSGAQTHNANTWTKQAYCTWSRATGEQRDSCVSSQTCCTSWHDASNLAWSQWCGSFSYFWQCQSKYVHGC